jgi:hypothetical protein
MTGGRHVIAAIGSDLAADPIVRQSIVAEARSTLARSMGSRPALVVIAVPAGMEDDVVAAIAPVLDPEGPTELVSEGYR